MAMVPEIRGKDPRSAPEPRLPESMGVGLVVKHNEAVHAKADDFERWLRDRGVRVIRKSGIPAFMKGGDDAHALAPADLFCAFILGGDGTFLSAARWVGHHPIPLIGIKFGKVGFLAEIPAQSLFSVAEEVLAGRFNIMPRTRLQVRVVRGNREIFQSSALNDVVISRGALARLSRFGTYVDSHYLTTFRSDGLIISSPTGSTAYCLAAGGPIIHPTVSAFVMTPICPFTLTNRPLIVPDTACITVRLDQEGAEALLSLDGQAGMEITERDTVYIAKSPYCLNMIVMPGWDYFDHLRTKLGWRGEAL